MSRHRHIVILTGAGISAESGLSTFRDPGGLWTKYDVADVATPEGFARDPALVHSFYNARRALLDKARPNAAHHALVRLQAGHPGRVSLITQNIDDLHERAGFKGVIHMHGEARKMRCGHCQSVAAWTGDLSMDLACGDCGRAGAMRPDVVWFGEMPMHMDEIGALLGSCDLFISIGTSGQVHPAAGFVRQVRDRAQTVELNLEPSAGHSQFAEHVHGPASDVVPAYVEALLAD